MNKTLKEIIKYAVPSIISMWVFTVYTMIDGMFIGNYVGEEGLAGVNIVMPCINFTFALGVMIAVGSSTTIAIYFGKQDYISGNKIFMISISLMGCLALLTTLLISFNIDYIIKLLGATSEIFNYAKSYLQITMLFCVCYMVGYALEIFIKVDGNPVYPTFCVIGGGIINLFFDYIFVAKLGYGISGAAWATGMSQLTATSLLFYYIFFRSKKVKFIAFKMRFKEIFTIICGFIKKGFAEFLAEISMGISVFIFNIVIIRNLGDSGVASYSVICYISTFVIMTMVGFNQGVQPLLSYNLGAKNISKIKSILMMSIGIIAFLQLFFYAVINIFDYNIIAVFLDNLGFASKTEKALTLYSFAYLVIGFNIFIAGYFTAINRVRISVVITLLRGVILISLYLFIFAKFFGSRGIWLSTFACEMTTLLFSGGYIIRNFRKLIKKI